MASTTTENTNGHADTHQPNADGEHDPTDDTSQPQADGQGTGKEVKEAKVQLLVKPVTHKLVRSVAERLGRSNDAVIRRAMHMLDKATALERALKDDDWANEEAS